MRRLLIVVVSSILFLSTSAVGFLFLIIQESLYFDAGSLEYHLFIPDEMKKMPLIGEGVATYFYSAGDGPKLPRTAVVYHSSLSREEIVEGYKAYFDVLGGEMQLKYAGDIEFMFPDKQGIKTFVLTITPDRNDHQVVLALIDG